MVMPRSKWTKRLLGDIAEEIRVLYEPIHSENLPYIGLGHIGQQTMRILDVGHSSSTESTKKVFRAGDILFGSLRPYFRKVVRPKFDGVCSTDITVLRARPSVDPRFLLYLVGSPQFISYATSVSSGTRMPRTNWDVAAEFECDVPDLDTQREIGFVLSAYDDLIENNLRRIAILEEMAQAIYREWFVEFRYPGHEDSALVESECGPIPDGWETMRLTDAVQVNPAAKVEKKLERPYADMACLSTSSMIVQFNKTRTGASGSKFQNGDTLVARITPCLENGKTGFVQGLPEDEVALGSTEFIVLRSVLLCPEYVYLMARADSFRQHAVKSMTGASGRQRVQIACFDDYLLAIPPRGLLDQFSMIAAPMFRQAWTLSEINDRLRQTRDLLLPRLISGELDVSNVTIDAEGDNL